MRIIMVSPECAPAAKVGGLGDVVHGLARELAGQGHAVSVVLPMYDCLDRDRVDGLAMAFEGLWVPFRGQVLACDVHAGRVDGIECFFVRPRSDEGFFDRGAFYGEADDALRFALFSKAALEFLLHAGHRPEILHVHDWQTGLVPVLLFEHYQVTPLAAARVCYTLHNLQHQGLCGAEVLTAVGLDAGAMMTGDRLADDHRPGTVNLMKGGIVYGNYVTTVSERYAREVRTTPLGEGLQGVLEAHRDKFGGVLNGIDVDTWNPAADPHIPQPYGADDPSGKAAAKAALRRRLELGESDGPLVCVVSRLDRQKGVELMRDAAFYALGNGGQFVLLGSAMDPGIDAHFQGLKRHLNDEPDGHLELGYDEDLAHLIYAAADLMVIPSLFEPCGLTQMIALRYGVVPVVRATGGLADTVVDANHTDRPAEARNGFVFLEADREGLHSALGRAFGLWYHYPDDFRRLRAQGMRQDFSWRGPARHYLDIYEQIRA